jgi:hypothetical protein
MEALVAEAHPQPPIRGQELLGKVITVEVEL